MDKTLIISATVVVLVWITLAGVLADDKVVVAVLEESGKADNVDVTAMDTTIDRLESYYDLHADLEKPEEHTSTLNPVLPDGRMNLDVFPDFPAWDCTAYKGQGEYECNIDRCRAMMQVLNFTPSQNDALCGTNWRLKGEIKFEAG